jgi:DNA polymerase-3 subunit epsilon
VVVSTPLDLRFLHAACRRHAGAPLLTRTIDILALAQRRRQRGHRQARAGELRLDALRSAFNLPRYPAHNALPDAFATAELFLALQQRQSHRSPSVLFFNLRSEVPHATSDHSVRRI